MCSGFEPLLFEAGGEALAGDLFLGDMAATGAGEGLASLGAAEAAGATALGDMAATGAGGGLTAGGIGGDYLASLGGLDTLAGSNFATELAPFTQSAADVASITNNAVPGLENNIGSFDGIPVGETPVPSETLPGLSQASNVTSRGISLTNPEAGLTGQNYLDTNAFIAPEGFAGQGISNVGNVPANGGLGMKGTMGAGTSLGYGSESLSLGAPSEGYFAGAGANAASTSPWSLSNLMNNPMGAVKSAYDTVSKNPIPSMYAAGSLYDMYAKNKMAAAQRGMYNQNRADIMNMYAPGSPEYNLLAQQIARADARAGRNSQVGIRANDLAATIAKLKMGALGNLQSGQNTLGNQALGNQYGMLNTPLMLAAYSAKT